MIKKQYAVLVILLIGLLCFSACSKITKADYNLAAKKYDEAIPIYEEFLSEKPDSIQARSRLGFAYLKTGRYDLAIEAFNTALSAKPGDPYSVLYLGMAYLHKEQFSKAVEVWQTYRNKKQPAVEKEVKRLMTLVLISRSQRLAKKAMAEEEKLKTIMPGGNTIAVFYYQDLSPDKSMLAFQKGLAAMVITDMSKIKSLKVVERLRLQALLEEMDLGKTGIVDDRTAPRAGRLVGAEKLVVGNLTLGINAATSLASTSEENIMGSAMCTEKREDFFKLPCCIIREVAEILRIDLTKQPEKICIVHTENYDAFIYFGKGLHEMDLGNWQEARDFFTKALKKDPQFQLAKFWLDACPLPMSPGIKDIKEMNGSELASYIETVIIKARQDQQAKEAAQKEMEKGGGGGGGGH